MDDDQQDVPWLKILGSGFIAGIKWVGVSLLVELPILAGMVMDLVSLQKGIRLAIGIPLIAVGMGILVALLGVIYIAYLKYRWMRLIVLTAFVLFFGVHIMMLVLIPYAMIYGFIFQPPNVPLPVFLVIIGLYAAFMYWWTRIQYGLFIKYNVIAKITGWIVRTANESKACRQTLRKYLAKD